MPVDYVDLMITPYRNERMWGRLLDGTLVECRYDWSRYGFFTNSIPYYSFLTVTKADYR